MAQQSARDALGRNLTGTPKIEAKRNEQRLQITLRNVGEGRKVAAERIPRSLLETGNVTPEENAAAAQEYEEQATSYRATGRGEASQCADQRLMSSRLEARDSNTLLATV